VSADSRGSREDILRAAHELMVEMDTVEISLSQIAEKAQLSAALVKYYFGSKDGMLLELLRQYKTAPGRLDALLAAPVSASEKLAMHIQGIVNVYSRAPYLNRLILTLLRRDSPMVKEISENFMRPMAEFHAKLLALGVQEGSMREIDPMSFNFMLVGACDNLFSRRAALPLGFGVPEITAEVRRKHVEELTRLFLAGVASDARAAGSEQRSA